jgi:hypothetical protein
MEIKDKFNVISLKREKAEVMLYGCEARKLVGEFW